MKDLKRIEKFFKKQVLANKDPKFKNYREFQLVINTYPEYPEQYNLFYKATSIEDGKTYGFRLPLFIDEE